MKTKYSHAKREQYGRLLASLLCDQHFGARPTATLDGPAVLRFTPIRQVNLFVVQQLLGKWTAEMTKLRSPYFDFEDADVRQALTQFMNILSRRIKLSRPVFEPLLAQAITDTLGGALAPTEVFIHKLLGEATTCTPEQLREGLRYIDLNKPVFESFLTTLPAQQEQERDYLVSRFRLHEEACAAELQPLAAVLESFNVLLPLTEKELYEEPAATEAAPAPATPPAAPPVQVAPPAPVMTAAPASTPPIPPVPEPTPAPVAAATAAVPAAAPAPKPTPEAPVEPRRPLVEPAAGGAVPLYEKLKAEQPAAPSLSETLRQERSSATLAEKAPRVESLREAISINQRFSFINELFNGENMEYHAAIQHLDTLPDASTAKRYVTENLMEQYGWVRKDEHINKLLKLIERKFSN
ncbi:hypothetical protein [Hymenobacter glacieicola]|uniref:DUF4476 domain-containing protein n=1 Tax=Hymenobacter glacieicola TaxID=1562124 RepID=A0ABQ1X3F0_9BACT|nr:hypothetical protein [Hymenobacter glacieicola]GGG57975.1 hypothetical protein GCM10011378_37590 [Hymenobacter glacieicola]